MYRLLGYGALSLTGVINWTCPRCLLRITVEQVRSAINVWLDSADLPPSTRRQRYEAELDKQAYYQRRNKQARVSHTKTRIERLDALGIDISKIKSCLTDTEES